MIVVCIVGLRLALSGGGAAALAEYLPTGKMTMIEAISFVIGGYALGAVMASDFTRYQRTRKDVWLSTFIGIFPLGVGLIIVGAILAITAESYDLTVIFVSLGIPVLGLLSLIMSTWPANAGNAYSSGLDVVKMFNFTDARRARATFVCGIIGTAVGCFDVIFYFETILTYMGIIVIPVGGVMIADYWVLSKGRAENWKPSKGVNIAGMISWAAGAVASLFIPWGVECINGMAISFVLYLLLVRVIKPVPMTVSMKDEKADAESRGEA
jgi:cytosine permease